MAYQEVKRWVNLEAWIECEDDIGISTKDAVIEWLLTIYAGLRKIDNSMQSNIQILMYIHTRRPRAGDVISEYDDSGEWLSSPVSMRPARPLRVGPILNIPIYVLSEFEKSKRYLNEAEIEEVKEMIRSLR